VLKVLVFPMPKATHCQPQRCEAVAKKWRYIGSLAIALALVAGWFWWVGSARDNIRLAATSPFIGTPTPAAVPEPVPHHATAPKTTVVQPKTVIVQPKTVVVQPKTVVVHPKPVVVHPQQPSAATTPHTSCEGLEISQVTDTMYRLTVHGVSNVTITGYRFTFGSATTATTPADHPFTDVAAQGSPVTVTAQVLTGVNHATPVTRTCTVVVPGIPVPQGTVMGSTTVVQAPPPAPQPVAQAAPATVPAVGGTGSTTRAVCTGIVVTQVSSTMQRFTPTVTGTNGQVSGFRYTFSDTSSTATSHGSTDKVMTGKPVKVQAQVLYTDGFVSELNDTCAVTTTGAAVGAAAPNTAAPPTDTGAAAPAQSAPTQTIPATGPEAGSWLGLGAVGVSATLYWSSRRRRPAVDKSRG
jgi:hypothetical protein